MRTSGLFVAVTTLLLALISVSPPGRPTASVVREHEAAAPHAPSRSVALPDRDVGHLTAAPRAGDTDRLAAAWQRRHHDPPDLVRAPGSGDPVGEGPLRRYAVEVEPAAGIAPETFAAAVDAILSDPRSWTAGGRYTLQRVDRGRVDLLVTLASPESVDALCWPLDTRGMQSCWNEDRAIINAFRWEHGATTYGTALDAYRAYLVNHEVGHGLGYEHIACPGPGEPAPVMVQQTITLGGCTPSPWPYPDASR